MRSPLDHRSILRLGIIPLLLIIMHGLAPAQPVPTADGGPDHSSGIMASMPLAPRGIRFVENRGQVIDIEGKPRPDILFTAASRGLTIYFRRDGISYVFNRWVPDEASRSDAPADPRRRLADPAPRGTHEAVRMDMAFIGANPYKQAHERGVKLIGATCHYVTDELDAGPIIEQEVERVQHFHSPADLVRLGRNCERSALAKGIRYHVHDRTILDGHRAIVFPD